MRSFTLASMFLVNTTLSAAVIQTCAWKDGSVAENYYPCTNATATSGNCCLQGEACTANGMCYGGVGLVYRGACINEWGGDCLTYCDDLTDKWANFYPCAYADSGSTEGPETWWCGSDGTDMCTQVNGTHIINITPGGPVKLAGVSSATVATTGTTMSTFTSSPSSKSSSIAANTPASNASPVADTCAAPKSNIGTMIGLGVVIGVLAVAGVAGGAWGHRKYRQQQKRLDALLAGHKEGDTSNEAVYQQEGAYREGAYQAERVYTPEMSTQTSLLKVEMDGRNHSNHLNAVELGGYEPKQ